MTEKNVHTILVLLSGRFRNRKHSVPTMSNEQMSQTGPTRIRNVPSFRLGASALHATHIQ